MCYYTMVCDIAEVIPIYTIPISECTQQLSKYSTLFL